MTALLVIQVLLLIITIALIALLLFGSKQLHKHSWRSGYWHGKADVHNSLQAMVITHRDELEADPSKLAVFLHAWLVAEVESDRTLVEVQTGVSQRD